VNPADALLTAAQAYADLDDRTEATPWGSAEHFRLVYERGDALDVLIAAAAALPRAQRVTLQFSGAPRTQVHLLHADGTETTVPSAP